MPFNTNLKKLRTQKNLTQKELANLAGVEIAQVSRIETGSSEPKLETIKNLAVALECKSDDLIFDNQKIGLSVKARTAFDEVEKLDPFAKACIIKVITSYCENENLYKRMAEKATEERTNKQEMLDESWTIREDTRMFDEELIEDEKEEHWMKSLAAENR